MNKQECDIMNSLLKEPYINQRILAETSGHSLGVVNKAVRGLIKEGYLNEEIRPTDKALEEVQKKAPENMIILAAGYGMRMVPINMERSKGLLEVNGEPLIERLIRQGHEAGIRKIYVVVGFMKEQYEYLIDQYGVELIVNMEYSEKNNLHSLRKAAKYLGKSYIVPCDIWCDVNPFSRYELYSWYMVSDLVDDDSSVRVNRKMELVSVSEKGGGNSMIGIAYLLQEEAQAVKESLEILCRDRHYDEAFWEEALYRDKRMIVQAKVVHSSEVVEINTYEQLRELDRHSEQLQSDAINEIAGAMQIRSEQITDITVLKKGMTNRSFLFKCRNQRYIMRIPGEGTDQLINRRQEAEVYRVIADKGICDDIVYMNPDNGYKITKYMEGARVCDPFCAEDVARCMRRLRAFHEQKLEVAHEFDIFGQIQYYESLWDGQPSVYRDYAKTKSHVLELKSYIDAQPKERVLTHIDAVPDNFLFAPEGDGEAEPRLIDWEYAGMQDPYVDIAMFAIYAMYDREKVEELISAYFTEGCEDSVRIRIYCYIAACGLLWSNWCEYKRNLGVEFGEYSIRQYRYAKDYYKIVQEETGKSEEAKHV